MKDFFRSLLASLVALGLFAFCGMGLLIGLVATMGAPKPTVTPRSVLVLNLSTNFPDSVQDASPGDLLQKVMRGQDHEGLPLTGLLQALDRAAHDKNISALYLTGNVTSTGYGSGPAALKEIREAIQRFKEESGKPVIAYNHAWSKREYYLCAGATKLYGNPSGQVDVTGLASEPMFFGGAFKKYGIEVQVTRVGKFKSAVEPYILDKMSDASREQMQSLLGDIWTEWKETVAKDRKLTPEAIQALADDKGFLPCPEALKAGLLDKVTTPDEVLNELKLLAGRRITEVELPQMDFGTYMKMPFESHGKNRIAVVYAEGEIVDGHGQDGQVGGDTLSRELRRLRLDKRVKAIVFRVNSPGGSALASDLIQREVILARKEKPVIISMGYLAASGGYWISTYGDRIFAEPNTITGSIGVFGMLPNVQKLGNEHGLTWDSVQTSRMANPMTIARPKTEAELARVQALVDGIYGQFLDKVAESRKMKREQVHEIAQGRVWSGRQALKLGLVDELGGVQDAIRYAAKMAKIEGDYRVDSPGEPKTTVEKLLKLLAGDKAPYSRSQAGPADAIIDQFQLTLGTLRSLNDPQGIYARMPFDLVLR
jgi:protease-4